MLNPVFQMRLGGMANVGASGIGLLYGFCGGWVLAGDSQWGEELLFGID